MRKVYSYYVLDIVHFGHLVQMMNAKAVAGPDGLSIIGILTKEAVLEKKPKPLLSFNERMNLARAMKYADLVVPQETYSPLTNLKNLKPDVCMECIEHDEEDRREVEEYMESIGGCVITTPYYPYISSTKIKKLINTS